MVQVRKLNFWCTVPSSEVKSLEGFLESRIIRDSNYFLRSIWSEDAGNLMVLWIVIVLRYEMEFV